MSKNSRKGGDSVQWQAQERGQLILNFVISVLPLITATKAYNASVFVFCGEA
jgi:hypothetical protein